jgi:hypothetical protein
MHGIVTIAHLTVHEARRRKIVGAALVCGLAFLLVFATGLFFINREFLSGSAPLIQRQVQLGLLTIAGLYATNFLSVVFAVLVPVDVLSGEIASGVIQTLASKPIRRVDILLGKWIAYWIVTAAYLLLMAGGVVLASRLITGYAQPNLYRALPLMLMEVTLLLTLSIAGGTRLSTVSNGIVAFGFYGLAFIGGWIEQIGALGRIDAARNVGIAVSLISPADSLWRLGAYYLQPAIARDLQMTPFASASVPSAAMVWWAGGFTIVTLALGLRWFERRPL